MRAPWLLALVLGACFDAAKGEGGPLVDGPGDGVDAAPRGACGGLGLLDDAISGLDPWFGQAGITPSSGSIRIHSDTVSNAGLLGRFSHELDGGAIELDVTTIQGGHQFALTLVGSTPDGASTIQVILGYDDDRAFAMLTDGSSATYADRPTPPFTMRLEVTPDGLEASILPLGGGDPLLTYGPRPLPAALERANVAIALAPSCPEGVCATAVTVARIGASGAPDLCPADAIETPEIPLDWTRWKPTGACTYARAGDVLEVANLPLGASCTLAYRLPTDLIARTAVRVTHPGDEALEATIALNRPEVGLEASVGQDGVNPVGSFMPGTSSTIPDDVSAPWDFALAVAGTNLALEHRRDAGQPWTTIMEAPRSAVLPAGPAAFSLRVRSDAAGPTPTSSTIGFELLPE